MKNSPWAQVRGCSRLGHMARPSLQERFWSKVDKNGPGGCWLWTSVITENGYGHFWIDGKYRRSHILVHEWLIGPIPEGYQVDHVASRGCTSKACVNPDHLEAVSPSMNTKRGAVSRIKEVCPQGHRRTIRASGKRVCNECHRRQERARWDAMPIEKKRAYYRNRVIRKWGE